MIEIKKAVFDSETVEELIGLSRLWADEGCTFGLIPNTADDLKQPCYTALDGGRIVGYVFGHYYVTERKTSCIEIGSRCFDVDELYVLPEYRSAGVGSKLLRRIEREAEENADYITLSTSTKDYKKILKFYAEDNSMTFHDAFLFKKTESVKRIGIETDGAYLTSLKVGCTEIADKLSPLFRMRMISKDGSKFEFDATDAKNVIRNGDEYIFSGLPCDVTVKLVIRVTDRVCVFASAENRTDMAIEWIVLMPVALPALQGDGGADGSSLLLPYNEGVIVSTLKNVPDLSPEYPSLGSYMMFPNMMFSQVTSYLYKDGGDRYLTIAAKDKDRGPKEITVRGGELLFKLYCGTDFGADAAFDYPMEFTAGDGEWEAAVTGYREFFEENLPPRVKKIKDNTDLPDWYTDNTLVVTYPVRGVHDMDKPEPNALFPYINALPHIDEIAGKTGMRPLALLMHWEGTAPWAPPYVWPPYGGVEAFNEFRDVLHDRGHMLGVYCSGFGYTKRSNLIPEYDNTEKIGRDDLLEAMCAGPDNKVTLSRICTAQRSGYDICPACRKGSDLLYEAYSPLFEIGIDYAQILDQNHGGGQYLCYSRDHGHAPMPGAWMTENMQKMLTAWNDKAGKMLLGCESAAAEPFIGNLLMSDDRYELSTIMGRPVPMYAFLYHEYVRNFMGNQVCDPLPPETDALAYRLAYSFAAGDVPTLVLTPDGGISPSWGTRDFSAMPDKDEILDFLRVLSDASKNGLAPYLACGRMITPPRVTCKPAPFGNGLPAVICTSWRYNGNDIVLLINPLSHDEKVEVDRDEMIIRSRSVRVINISET